MDIKIMLKESDQPVRSKLMTWAELVELSGCGSDTLADLLEMNWITPARSANQADLYSHTDVYRLRKLKRICSDLEVPVLGGTIIVDLLTKVGELERKVQELQAVIGGR